jgi:hypothetical protein
MAVLGGWVLLSLQKLTLEGINEPLLSLGSFFRRPRDAHGVESSSSSSSYIAEVKMDPCHLTQLKLGKLIGSSSGWEVLHCCSISLSFVTWKLKGAMNLGNCLRPCEASPASIGCR